MLRNVRTKTLKRLLVLHFVLASRFFHGHPSVKGRGDYFGSFVWEVQTKEVMDILWVSWRAAMDYRYALRQLDAPGIVSG